MNGREPPLRRSQLPDDAARRPWYLARPIIHRGLHNLFDGVLEHSRRSIERAVAAGLPIEVDIETSLDDCNFVIHDAVLDKLTDGSGRIRQLPARQIRAHGLKLAGGEPIMFLEELLELVGGRVPLVLEFKNRELSVARGIALAAQALARYRGDFAVTSFSPLLIEWFAEHHPGFTRGLITTDTDTLEGRDPFLVCLARSRMRPHFISHQWCQLNCWTFQWVLEQDVPIIAWTVRDHGDWAVAREFADNMMFEYIAPDRRDWRRESTLNWRADVGERVDRRHARNHPNYLKHDEFKGSQPWWSRNRSWAPALASRPQPPGTETAASYDGALWQMSVFENKRDLYRADPHFRACWRDWLACLGVSASAWAHRAALLLVRPDARSDPATPALLATLESGFSPRACFEVTLDRAGAHDLMRHEWPGAATGHIERELARLADAPALAVMLVDDSLGDGVTHGIPGAVRLSALMAQSGALGALGGTGAVHANCVTCLEPADLIRTLGALLAEPARRDLLFELAADRPSLGWQTLRCLVPRGAAGPRPEHEGQALLPDRAGPFAALGIDAAWRLWAARCGK